MTASRNNRFGFEEIDDVAVSDAPRRRNSGPMSTAVRDTAQSVEAATEAKIAQRQQNAADAKAWRAAQDGGLVLKRVALDDIHTDDLPRDRLDLDGVATSDEMDELKASIRAHGQKEPIELYSVDGRLQLKKGWRRLSALRALLVETGEPEFGTALARVVSGEDRLRNYIDMVEENILREDLSFAEMAQVAIEAAADARVEGSVADDMVTPLYASLHKVKRSYIRSFIVLIETLGEHLRWPKAVRRDLGVDVARAIRDGRVDVSMLKRSLMTSASPDEQNGALASCIASKALKKPAADARKKFEFHVGDVKVTARKGEVRLKGATDFSEVPRDRLEAAVAAFRAELDG